MNQKVYLFTILLLVTRILAKPAYSAATLLSKLDILTGSGLNGSELGKVVSDIGDVNNDGCADWAIGFS